MDFSLEYTEEQHAFAVEVRAWLGQNIPDGFPSQRDPLKTSYEQWLKQRELGRRLGKKGWLYPTLPLHYGGGGLDADHSFVIVQELAERCISLPPYYSNALAIPAILAYGTENQKERFLRPILQEAAVAWQLFTEPEAGTDEANQQSTALRHVRDKDYFILNGQKLFIGGGYTPPDWLWVLTCSDLEASRHMNLATFIIPSDLQGISFQPFNLFTSGTFPHVTGPAVYGGGGLKYFVFFDDVRIHKSYMIGKEGEGWRVAKATLDVEHSGGNIASIARNFVAEKLFNQCRKNPVLIKRIKENPQLIDKMANIYIGAETGRLLSMRNTWLSLSGKRVPYTGPQLSLYLKTNGEKLVADMAEILGPYAFTDDAEWGLDGDMFEVVQRSGVCVAPGGTPEALKIIISRALRIGR
ncbi:acyl-CoA dehydrogenase family protein [Thermodesulfobacteriota bacterium]